MSLSLFSNFSNFSNFSFERKSFAFYFSVFFSHHCALEDPPIPHVTVGPRSHKRIKQGQNIDLSNHFIFRQGLVSSYHVIDCDWLCGGWVHLHYHPPPGRTPEDLTFLFIWRLIPLSRVRKRRRFPSPGLQSTSSMTICAIGMALVVSMQQHKHTFCQEGYYVEKPGTAT